MHFIVLGILLHQPFLALFHSHSLKPFFSMEELSYWYDYESYRELRRREVISTSVPLLTAHFFPNMEVSQVVSETYVHLAGSSLRQPFLHRTLQLYEKLLQSWSQWLKVCSLRTEITSLCSFWKTVFWNYFCYTSLFYTRYANSRPWVKHRFTFFRILD